MTNPWATAKSLEDLAEITVRWLQGEGFEHPLGGDRPDEETASILGDLLLLNRRGLVTAFSQPGVPLDDEGNSQRAAVEGFATKALAWRIAALTLHTDLLVYIWGPGESGGYQVPITVQDFHPFTWCGHHDMDDMFEHFQRYYSNEGLGALLGAWTIIAIDPRWGRKRRLWQWLRRASLPTGDASPFSISPSPLLDFPGND